MADALAPLPVPSEQPMSSARSKLGQLIRRKETIAAGGLAVEFLAVVIGTYILALAAAALFWLAVYRTRFFQRKGRGLRLAFHATVAVVLIFVTLLVVYLANISFRTSASPTSAPTAIDIAKELAPLLPKPSEKNKMAPSEQAAIGAEPKSTERPAKPSRSTTPSPKQPPSVSAPYGIAIGGDNLGTATVNNYGPPERRLSQEDIDVLASTLATFAGKVRVEVNQLDGPEPDKYAVQFVEVFRKAGWEVDRNDVVRFIAPGHVSHHGIMFRMRESADRQRVDSLYQVLRSRNVQVVGLDLLKGNDVPDDLIIFWVGSP